MGRAALLIWLEINLNKNNKESQSSYGLVVRLANPAQITGATIELSPITIKIPLFLIYFGKARRLFPWTF